MGDVVQSSFLVSDAPIKFASVNASADGDNSVIAAVTGKKLRVLSYTLEAVGAAVASIVRDATANTERMRLQPPAAASAVVASYAGGPSTPAFETAAGEGLEVNNGVGVDLVGHIAYQEA